VKPPVRSGLWYQIVNGYVRFSYRQPLIPLILLGVLTWLAYHFTAQLRIDTDLRVLLPKGTPSVVALQQAEKRMGSTDLFTVAFQSKSIEEVGAFQKAVAESLSHWKEVAWVQYDQDRSFFERHALMYLPTDQLEDLRDRISGMIGGGFAKANPLVESLDDTPAGKPGLEGWPNVEALRRQGLPQDLIDALLAKVRKGKKDSAGMAQAAQSANPEDKSPPRPDSLKTRLMGWHPEKGMWVGVVLAQMNHPSTDAIFSKQIYERGQALLDGMHPERFAPDLVAKVVGAYRNFNEINQVTGDIIISSTISLVLILLLLWFFVRKVLSVLLVMVPLTIAMTWTTGVTYLIYERLTLLTMFILALIAGLGIEYTVHLYSRWAEEGRNGYHPLDAMIEAVYGSGRSLLAGAASNIFAMASLQLGHFKGFKEFGVVVSLGITFALLTTWLVLPPLFFLIVHITDWIKAKLRARWIHAVIDFLMPSGDVVGGGILLPHLRMGPKVLKVLAVCTLLFTLAVSLGPRPGFENDFEHLRGKSTSTGISYGRAVGAGRNTSPSIILGHSEAQMRSVHDSLAARYGNPADSMLKSFATIQSFVPAVDQQRARLKVLAEIRDLLGARALERADSATRADLDLLRRYLGPSEFGFDSLPDWAKRFLTEANGHHGEFGYLYGELKESDALESAKFQERFGTVPSDEGPVMVASSGFIYADVVRMVKGDGVRLAIYTFLILIFITWLDMRSWRGVLISCGFVALSAWWTFKIMGIIGLKLGMFNLVVLPTILSSSVDSVIHLYHRRLELGKGKIGELYQTTGSAVLAGTLNNVFGFLGLCFVAHKGMQTIGYLSVLGIGCGLLVMFTVLPWLLEWLCPAEPVHE
jgi:predicted exporter